MKAIARKTTLNMLPTVRILPMITHEIYIRHNIIPCLKKLNPSFERTALGLSENAGESAAFIKKCAEKAMRDCKGDFGYDCKKLLSLDSAVLKEMIV